MLRANLDAVGNFASDDGAAMAFATAAYTVILHGPVQSKGMCLLELVVH
jgi:hypothetical protein